METKIIILKILSFLVIILNYIFFDYINFEQKECPNGYFRIGGMKSCHQLLDCSDYKDITSVRFFSRGLVKKIYLVEWNNNYLIVSNLSQSKYQNDFTHNLQALKQLSPNPLVIQLVGFCGTNSIITEFTPFGDATNLPSILTQINQNNNISIKLNLCINYVKILDFLHNSPIGTRVMCDTNTLDKTLSQYLVTPELNLVVNDLDALPQVIVGSKGIKCGSRQLFGSFVAPEQLWHKNDVPFDDNQMREYDHKTDIWKIPEVCDWFLSAGTDIQLHAQPINLIKKPID